MAEVGQRVDEHADEFSDPQISESEGFQNEEYLRQWVSKQLGILLARIGDSSKVFERYATDKTLLKTFVDGLILKQDLQRIVHTAETLEASESDEDALLLHRLRSAACYLSDDPSGGDRELLKAIEFQEALPTGAEEGSAEWASILLKRQRGIAIARAGVATEQDFDQPFATETKLAMLDELISLRDIDAFERVRVALSKQESLERQLEIGILEAEVDLADWMRDTQSNKASRSELLHLQEPENEWEWMRNAESLASLYIRDSQFDECELLCDGIDRVAQQSQRQFSRSRGHLLLARGEKEKLIQLLQTAAPEDVSSWLGTAETGRILRQHPDIAKELLSQWPLDLSYGWMMMEQGQDKLIVATEVGKLPEKSSIIAAVEEFFPNQEIDCIELKDEDEKSTNSSAWLIRFSKTDQLFVEIQNETRSIDPNLPDSIVDLVANELQWISLSASYEPNFERQDLLGIIRSIAGKPLVLLYDPKSKATWTSADMPSSLPFDRRLPTSNKTVFVPYIGTEYQYSVEETEDAEDQITLLDVLEKMNNGERVLVDLVLYNNDFIQETVQAEVTEATASEYSVQVKLLQASESDSLLQPGQQVIVSPYQLRRRHEK